MIRFINVHGNVWVDDKKGKRTLAPTPGMTIPFKGADCIIATGQGGRATLSVKGEQMKKAEVLVLKEKSFFRIQPDGRSFVQKHWEKFTGQGRIFFGRLWAISMKKFGTDRWEITGSGGGGIRG